MNPYRRAARFLLRLVGAGLALVGLMLVSGDVVGWLGRSEVKTPWFIVLLQVVPMLLGVWLLLRSDALATSFTAHLEETEEKTAEELLDSDDTP